MKKITAILLCAVMLLMLASCAKEVDPAEMLPDTMWDNHTSLISISFESDGLCTVSNANSKEQCPYTVEGDKLTITGALSTWEGVITKDSITINDMEGTFTKIKERSYFPNTESYGYVISEPEVEQIENIIYDLSFWYGSYKSGQAELTIGESGILNTLTYMIKLDKDNIINGTIRPSQITSVLENSVVRITLTELGAIVEAVDETFESYGGTYIKQKLIELN